MNDAVITAPVQSLNPKQFYRQIESIFERVSVFRGAELFARSFVARFLEEFSSPLAIQSAQLYETLESFTLLCSWGSYAPDFAEEISALRIRSEEFPWIGKLGNLPVALLPVSQDQSFLAMFVMDSSGTDLARLSSVYSALHYAISLNLRLLQLQGTLEQARAIQLSLLPSGAPEFYGYEIAAATVPARSVGGDIYDFHVLSPRLLAIALGDASGHALPAALQARDVITGLRMGWSPEMDLVNTVERLNGVIHRSGLGSRFVSLIAALLDSDGDLQYINAGHPSPLILDSSGFQELKATGMILGPFPWNRYTEAKAQLEPGAMLVLYSDGIPETSDGNSEFGISRLKSWMSDWRRGPAQAAVEDLLARLETFRGAAPIQDDVTILVVKRS